MKRIIVSIILILCFFSCSKKNLIEYKLISPEDLLIRDNEISGWQRSGSSWVARSYGELTSYIDGEAVIYTNRGFVEAAFQIYQGKVRGNIENIELRIFDQGNQENAKSVFFELVNQMSSPMDWNPGAGEEAKIERFPLSQKVIFWKSNLFISLSITSGIEEALNILKTFANNLDDKI
jgi:hypothetical protein